MILMFYVAENPNYTIFDSMKDSVRFVVERTLIEYNGNLACKSSFVDVEGNPMSWHDFGTLEGPGWAANAVGGSYELYRFGCFTHNEKLKQIALALLDHILKDGFINYETGFIWPYRDIKTGGFCLNYKHNNDWFCPGSLAKIAYQMLIYSDILPDSERKRLLREVAVKNAQWICNCILSAPNGWYPRRSSFSGRPYKMSPEGKSDPIFSTSGDGLFILQLLAELTKKGLANYKDLIREKVSIFMKDGGYFGSINHDTYDQHECVSYAVAFRVLREVSNILEDIKVKEFAYRVALEGLKQFEMCEDRNGVATTGLLFMEESWDTAYLWENAEAALAYFEAYNEMHDDNYVLKGLTILRAIAKHHHGEYGFLTEGVDWNNHVGAIHHFDGVEYGDIKYTEPLLNNLHITEPTLYYLENLAIKTNDGKGQQKYYDHEGNLLVSI